MPDRDIYPQPDKSSNFLFFIMSVLLFLLVMAPFLYTPRLVLVNKQTHASVDFSKIGKVKDTGIRNKPELGESYYWIEYDDGWVNKYPLAEWELQEYK